jgi:hypothetical protein
MTLKRFPSGFLLATLLVLSGLIRRPRYLGLFPQRISLYESVTLRRIKNPQ